LFFPNRLPVTNWGEYLKDLWCFEKAMPTFGAVSFNRPRDMDTEKLDKKFPSLPVNSGDPRLDMYLNTGHFFGNRPIYIHYTSEAGFKAISASKSFSPKPNTDRRSTAKTGLYLVYVSQAFSRVAAHVNLFFEIDKYEHSADYCFVFSFRDGRSLPTQPISAGSPVHEIVYAGSINFHEIDLIYSGENKFTLGPAD
jgi:hypothetical protein